jgi:hypothetical protein
VVARDSAFAQRILLPFHTALKDPPNSLGKSEIDSGSSRFKRARLRFRGDSRHDVSPALGTSEKQRRSPGDGQTGRICRPGEISIRVPYNGYCKRRERSPTQFVSVEGIMRSMRGFPHPEHQERRPRYRIAPIIPSTEARSKEVDGSGTAVPTVIGCVSREINPISKAP